MSESAKDILERVAGWPEEDRQELAEVAREIEDRRRPGVYVLCDDEKAAIGAARRGGFASDDQVTAFWKRLGIA
jgi:hypothetical protein